MKAEDLDTKGGQNKKQREVKTMKKENKKQENKKSAAPAAAPTGKPECKKCGRKHAGDCEEIKCEYCYADPTKSDNVKKSHFTNQCRFQFPNKARQG